MTGVVLDANVLVFAALASDPAAPSVRAFDALLDGRIEVVGCPALLGEIASVLGRERLRRDLLELEDVGVPVITPRALVERLADAG